MPNVILFRPLYDPAARSVPTFPWSLMYLSAVLVDRGVDVTIIDEACTPDCRAYAEAMLELKRPLAVGITAMTGDQIRYGLEWARLTREHSQAAIVWGGVHASLLPEQTARHDLVDYVVAGEGEYAFADLVDCLAQREDPGDIPGVFLKRGGEVIGSRQEMFCHLASLPEIPYDLVDVERYICRRPDLGAERYFEICTSRGCPHRCGFCYAHEVHRSAWRWIDAPEVVARIKALVERFHVDCLLFREDNFFVQRKRVEEIARGLIEANVGIKWAASCRIDYFARYTPEFLDLLRRSGCVLLTFGVESGSDRVLEHIGKGITVDLVLETAREVQASGIRGTYHFMGGFPGETAAEFLETCRLIGQLMEIAPDCVVRELSMFAPYPGVGLIPDCLGLGYLPPEDLEGWIAMDWDNARQPWLAPDQSRLINDAQFLIARLRHPNPIVRAWVRVRWNQLVGRRNGIRLTERPVFEFLKRGTPRI